MGLFSFLFERQDTQQNTSIYSRHPEELQQIASSLAACAVRDMFMPDGYSSHFFLYIEDAGRQIRIEDYMYSQTSYYSREANGLKAYVFPFSRFGMERVGFPDDFLDALLPFLKTELENELKWRCPKNVGVTAKSSTFRIESNWGDLDERIPAIEIKLKDLDWEAEVFRRRSDTTTPKLKEW